MRYSYGCELKFIIPHFKEVDGVMSAYDYQNFKKDLFYNFEGIGLNYYLVLPIKEVVDGIEYDSEQVVVYCDEVMEQVIIREFQENCCRQHKQLGINNFFYIQNGVLINLIIGDELGMKEGDC